jgi:putative peptidoglycan lipid II flippase
MSSKLLKSTAIVSAMTLISRVSGLIRDVVMASVLGSSGVADAFFVAFRIPNFLRRIFGEGAFAQAFVPVFTELTERNTYEAKQFVNSAAGLLALITLILTLFGMVFAPALIAFYAPGYKDDPVQMAATVDALRYMFPYLFCISLVAMSAGVLNTLNRFAIPAVTPVLLNVCLVLVMWLLVPLMDSAASALAIGVLIAGVVQLLFQVPSLYREGYLPKFAFDRSNPAVKKVFGLMLPAVFSVSVAQINMFVNTVLASFLVTGSVSWLYYSDRLMEFPVGVFGIALASVVLPSLSKEHISGSADSFSELMDWALRWVILIAVPATFALYLLATPLLSTIFLRNAFTVNDVEMSALALEAFSIGICGFIFVKVLAPGFFARQDTKTPMKIAVVSVLVNVLMSIVLVRYMQHTGLALAISIAAWVNAGLLFMVLVWRGVYKPQNGWLWFLLRVAIAVAAMSAVLIFLGHSAETWYQWSLMQRVMHLVILVASGGASYAVILLLLGVRPQQLLLKPTLKK